MGRAADVEHELEAIGAIGATVVLFRPEPLKMVPPPPGATLDEQLAAQQMRFDEERQQWLVLVELAAAKVEALANEVVELRGMFRQMTEAAAHKESHATIQEEA